MNDKELKAAEDFLYDEMDRVRESIKKATERLQDLCTKGVLGEFNTPGAQREVMAEVQDIESMVKGHDVALLRAFNKYNELRAAKGLPKVSKEELLP